MKCITYKFKASNDLTECKGENGSCLCISISALVVTNFVLEIFAKRDNSPLEIMSSFSSSDVLDETFSSLKIPSVGNCTLRSYKLNKIKIDFIK